MRAILSFFEIGFVVLVALWTLGSVLFAVPRRWGRGWLSGFNHGLWFADWTVFGTGREDSGIVRFTLEYRDRAPGQTTEWRVALRGRPWKWHACLWQPERRLADRVHRLGRDFGALRDAGVTAQSAFAGRGKLLARHLDAKHPRPPGTAREIRLTRRRSVLRYPAGAAAERPAAEIVEEVVLERTEAAP